MDKIEKDTNLMSGKGEWNESDHPRDEEGKFTKGGGDTQVKIEDKTADTANKENKQETIKPKSSNRQLVDKIMSFQPIEMQIGDRTIIAQFDKYSAKKNIYGRNNSDKQGYQYKINNVEKLPQIIRNSTYTHSKPESGKKLPQHRGVQEWHYFINQIETEKGVFDITINIRDNGFEQFVYEVAFIKKK